MTTTSLSDQRGGSASLAGLHEYLKDRRERVDKALDRWLTPAATPPAVIHEAMRYSVLAGGKRIRPILAIAAAEACGHDSEPFLKAFCALELIHTYSLVHDDLPAIDNDDLRRGRKTAHIVFGEAMAILAGDALLTEAFSWLAELLPVPAERQLRAVRAVAEAVDSKGMIGGQVADIESERLGSDQQVNRGELLDFIHRNKTGRLLTASVVLGGILAGASEETLVDLQSYGESVGLSFQIIDDLLDEEETAETLGKTAGKDLAQGKLTFPAVYGASEARERAAFLLDNALASADKIRGGLNYLGPIARYLCERRS
ncbi:MAG TPA: farnesyl diphosphate synthase [Thermoanaerobaculia bacterium]|nr:farnesyl diphosphate synthase [Thermoanaerobaculia bacterium]